MTWLAGADQVETPRQFFRRHLLRHTATATDLTWYLEQSIPRFSGSGEVRLAVEALRACGREPVLVETGGGSDAGALIEKGFPAVCLCNDMIDVHTDRERIAVSTLEAMVDVSLALIEAARSAT